MLLILSKDYLLREAHSFINGYMVEALVKGIPNFISRFFVKSVF